MYAQHQSIISAWAQKSPANFARVGLMCILSARQPFDQVGRAMAAVLDGDRRPLWSWKGHAWDNLRDNATLRFNQLASRHYHPDADLLAVAASWPGFGFIKGGFLLQLVFGRLGCLDSRNADDFGLGRIREPDLRRPMAFRRHARRYAETCQRLGGPAYLWDYWCAGYVRASGRLTSPWQVSAEHCRILGLDPGADPAEIPYDPRRAKEYVREREAG